MRVIYGYESSGILTTDRLHYKLQIRPLVREGAPKLRANQLSDKRKEKEKCNHGSQRCARHQDVQADWPSVIRSTQLNSTQREPGPPSWGSLKWDSKVWLRVLRDSDHWVIALQIADPSSLQTGRPTETRPQISDINTPTGSNIWSQVPQGCSIPRHADWLTDCQS
jgi:hypothetical protein